MIRTMNHVQFYKLMQLGRHSQLPNRFKFPLKPHFFVPSEQICTCVRVGFQDALSSKDDIYKFNIWKRYYTTPTPRDILKAKRNAKLKLDKQEIVVSRSNPSNSRLLPTLLSDETTSKLEINDKDWETLYRFEHIKIARIIQRLKVFQTAFTCCLVLPTSIGLFLYDAIPLQLLTFVGGTSIFACLMLYTMGNLCSNLIGIIYSSKIDPSVVRVGHMNFWGRREDKILKKADFMPFSELPDNISDVYIIVKLYSDPELTFRMSVRYGVVHNKVDFENLFGTYTGIPTKESKENGNKSTPSDN